MSAVWVPCLCLVEEGPWGRGCGIDGVIGGQRGFKGTGTGGTSVVFCLIVYHEHDLPLVDVVIVYQSA